MDFEELCWLLEPHRVPRRTAGARRLFPVKNCSPWEGPTLEKFMEDCLPWEGPHIGAEEECEEEETAETCVMN